MIVEWLCEDVVINYSVIINLTVKLGNCNVVAWLATRVAGKICAIDVIICV